nr:PREDICTED: uncharacterized protein LOC105674136 [Linepithema humile]
MNITKKNVWDYYKESRNLQAKCIFCKLTFSYVSLKNFYKHIDNEHEDDFKSIVNGKRRKTPEIYYNKLKSVCLVCKNIVSREMFPDHIQNSHSVEEVTKCDQKINKQKYCTQINTFGVRCMLMNCNKTIIFAIEKTGLKNHLASKHKKKWKNKQTGAMCVPIEVKNAEKKTLLDNYRLIPECFQANCKFRLCIFRGCYINTTNFTEHVIKDHKEISSYEDINGEGYPWMYFKYYDEDYSQCLLCQDINTVTTLEDLLKYHLENTHFATFPFNHNGSSWVWKYCTKIKDFHVRCNLCSIEKELDVQLTDLNQHIENTHLNEPTSTKRAYDIAGSSASQP